MPRKPRSEEAGAIHHVFARGVERRRLFIDAADYSHYLGELGRITKRQGWNVLSFCLMPNHVHLLIETPEPNLGQGMQRFHGLYAAGFNERHERTGHLFERRYGNVRVRSDAQLLAAATYISLNPVKAGLCQQPQDWPWSSDAPAIRAGAPTWLALNRLLELYSAWDDGPLAEYAAAIDRRSGV